jgi:ATP-dependent protease ClpP protease subunit
MKHSTFLIHQGSGGGFEGTYAQVVAAIDEYQRKIGELYDYLLETTKIPENVLQDNIGTEWFLSAEEAQMYGMCDKVVDSINEVLEVSDG